MTWDELQSNWTAMIPAMQARWPGLIEEDLIAMNGIRAEVIAAVSQTTGDSLADAERQIEAWMQGPMPADAYAHPTHDNAAADDAGRYVPVGEDVYADDGRFGDDNHPDRPIGRDGT